MNAFSRWPWLAYVLPLAVFLALTSLEPATDPNAEPGWLPLAAEHYPLVYAVKMALVVVAVAVCWPAYRRLPFAITPLGILVGLVGAAIWIGLCEADLEERILPAVGLQGLLDTSARAAYNPFDALGERPAVLYGFLAVRFLGLALVVPIIEEFFIRGFLMRYLTANDWQKVRVEEVSYGAMAGGIAIAVLMHPPAEYLAAIAWFTLVTWLMVRTRSVWDCVAAHAITNAVLGIYVLAYDRWELW